MARRLPGEFVPSDVDTVHDPAIRAAGYKAELLFRRANEYSKRTKSDGVVPKYDLPIVGIGIPGPLAPLAAALVRVGLWQDSGDNWTIPKYLKWNLSQSEIADDKEAKRLGAIKTNHKRHAEPDRSCPICRGEMESL